MTFVVWEQFKIFYSVIIKNAIDVMYNFFWLEIPANRFFHCKAMFKNITTFVSKRMFRFQNTNISTSAGCFSATFPLRIFVTYLRFAFSFAPSSRKFYTFMRNTHFHFCFFGMYLSCVSKFKFFFSKFALRSFEIFFKRFAYPFSNFRGSFINSCSHNKLQIKKAAFRLLTKERLDSFTLLTALKLLGNPVQLLANTNISNNLRMSR